MGYGPRESSSSSSWRSLLDSCLSATRAAGDEVRASHEPAGQQAPFVADKDRLSSPVTTGSDLHAFTYAELRAATGGFPSRNIIGEGGFGAVYMGSLEDGIRPGLVAQAVAVKRGLADDYVEELLKEAMFVAQLQHRHPSLVKMIGYCYHGNQRLLVYEFMGHGSLDNYLSKPSKSALGAVPDTLSGEVTSDVFEDVLAHCWGIETCEIGATAITI